MEIQTKSNHLGSEDDAGSKGWIEAHGLGSPIKGSQVSGNEMEKQPFDVGR